MLLESLAQFQENQTRLREILYVLGKYGLAHWLGSSPPQWIRKWLTTPSGEHLDRCSQEERIRLALLELGTTFIKLGQMLSTRPDLIGRQLADELSKLQCNTPADSIDIVRRTIVSELGKPPEELFTEFSSQSLASASIGQVHQAKVDGQSVVVKVRHDGIEKTIHRDLILMHGLAELSQRHLHELQIYNVVDIVQEFRRTILRELDFNSERNNLEEFARRFASDNEVHFPEVYPALSSNRVLTMEMLDGVLGRNAERDTPAEVRALFARRAVKMYLDMIFRDGFFHADPHPGNYMILPDGVVGVLDCGMVGRLDEGLREEFEGAIFAIADCDIDELTDRIVRIGSTPPNIDRRALRASLAEFVTEYSSKPIKETNLGAALGEIVDIIARFRIRLPRNASLLLRTLMVLEGSARQLDSKFSLIEMFIEYRSLQSLNWAKSRKWLRDARKTARSYTRLFRTFPEDLADCIHRFRNGTFELKHDHRHLQESINRVVRGLIATAFIISAALLLSRDESSLTLVLRPVLGFTCFLFGLFVAYRLFRSISTAEQDRWK